MENRIRRLLMVVALSTAAWGCAHGAIGELPPLQNPATAAEITVIRDVSFVGSGNSYMVMVDGQELYGIRIGEYVTMKVDSGTHLVGVNCFGGWTPTWKERTSEVLAKANGRYFFLISAGANCARIEPIEEDEGQALTLKSRLVPPKK